MPDRLPVTVRHGVERERVGLCGVSGYAVEDGAHHGAIGNALVDEHRVACELDHHQLVQRHCGDPRHQSLGALVQVVGLRRFDRQTPLVRLLARQAISGQHKAFRPLIAELVRPQPGGRYTPYPGGRVPDLGIGSDDQLVGMQGDVGTTGHAIPVHLHHGRLVGVQQRGEAAGEPAHHLVVEHGVPVDVRQVVAQLHLTV